MRVPLGLTAARLVSRQELEYVQRGRIQRFQHLSAQAVVSGLTLLLQQLVAQVVRLALFRPRRVQLLVQRVQRGRIAPQQV